MAPSADNEGFINRNKLSATEQSTNVTVVGAGPSGLMLANNLARYGVKTIILDDRPGQTSTGKADGMQPKTIETFRQLRLADPLFKQSCKVYDICFWESTPTTPLKRTGRKIHYPDHVGASDPYILLAHQGILEDVLIKDMEERGLEVTRNSPFVDCSKAVEDSKLDVVYEDLNGRTKKVIRSDFLVGCDGARSKVRPIIPDARLEGEMTNASWGVLDGVIETDFPDLWSKTAVRSHDGVSILWIPRERNMTRLYVELSATDGERIDKSLATPEYVMNKAREVMAPFKLEWKSIEWFGNYVVGQRVANHFSDPELQMFIAGDAGHCHSALAAQGANTSMHDSFNLAWKLNLVLRGVAQKSLLTTYEHERRKIAQDLINFDAEHVKAFADGDEALARNFDENIRFISGVGAEYANNILNLFSPDQKLGGSLRPGALVSPPTRVTRYVDANPVDFQLDIPLLGQFRIYIFAPDMHASKEFISSICEALSSPASILSGASARAEKSYNAQPPIPSPEDAFIVSERYTAVSKLFTYALVTQTPKPQVEIADLPRLLQTSRWTFYTDDLTSPSCTERYLGPLSAAQVGIVNVRPDGYVGSLNVWDSSVLGAGEEAARWVENYYGGFLKV
ncbi:FAD binding domain protein [Paecilomyces variotii No. 5]|uniref:FAD binding domain protein n=1 Tax=Byssochlamys spectabilis (strain No. 5 / NBRC 109023) TaxID=1356009 RepID=V5I5G2_BYSSN|nr:FAD binding domain protein [Paecilomyces variotii No. 5]